MKLSVVLLLFLLIVHLLEANAPRSPAGLGAVVLQTGLATTDTPVTVEGRTSLRRELEEAVQVALGNGQTLEAARILNRIGGLHLLLNEPRAALASHLQALELLRQSPDPQVEVDNLNGSAAAYLNLPHSAALDAPDNEALAQSTLDKALKLSREFHYTNGEAQALLTLSDLQNRFNHATALLTAQEALALWRNGDDKAGLARAYMQIGTCYLAQNLVNEAVQNFAQALELWRGLNDSAQQAATLISLGFAEFRKAEWQACIRYISEAYQLLDERAEPLQMGRIAATLGAAFIENGSPEVGVIQYQRALDHYQQSQDSFGISYAAWGLGRSYFFAGDLTQATSYFQQSLELVKPDSLVAAPSLEYLGRVHSERGEYPAAFKYLKSALEIYTESGNPKEQGRVLALLGQVYERQGMLGQARRNYGEALKVFIRLSDRVNQAALYFAIGQLEMKQQRYDIADNYLQQSIDVTKDLRRAATSSDLTAAFSASVQDRYAAYIQCLMKQDELQPTRGFAVRAFEISELGRGRALAEFLLAVQTNLAPGIDPQLATQEKSLRQALIVIDDVELKLLRKEALKASNAQDKLKALQARREQLENEYKNLNEVILGRYPSYNEISKSTAWNLEQIQHKILDDEAVLLEYTLGAEDSYAWTITRNEFKSYKLPPQAVIEEAVRRVYKLLSTASAAEKELAQATAALSQLVLAPLASSLNKQRIILVADGALNYVPFQLLSALPAANEPLISNYEVVNVPSASILGQLREEKRQRRPKSKILAAFGDPVFSSNYAQFKDSTAGELVASVETVETERWRTAWRDVEINADIPDPYVIQPLPYSKSELKNLRDIGGSGSFVARGFDASRHMLETTDLSEYAILHFATHGLLDPKRPEFSGFFLSMVDASGRPQDGFITVDDVYRLHAPVDLVVLSACRTGLGKDVRGEGLIGLTRGFMFAGASSVVSSLWKVDDEATSELMKHFYANMLQKSMKPSEALRAAQNRLRQDPQWQSPHLWAGFTLQGEFEQAISVPATRGASSMVQKAVVGGLLMALLAGMVWSYWRRRTLPRKS